MYGLQAKAGFYIFNILVDKENNNNKIFVTFYGLNGKFPQDPMWKIYFPAGGVILESFRNFRRWDLA